MSEVFGAVVVSYGTMVLVLAWLAYRAVSVGTTTPDRLVLELRLAQFSALLLVSVSSAYIGLAVAHEQTTGMGLDVAVATGFLVAASVTATQRPAVALTTLAVFWILHSLVDLAHMTHLLPNQIASAWYPTTCAIYDVGVAAICYLPVLRR